MALTLLFMLSLSPALLASCGGQQQTSAPEFSPEKVADLDQALDDFMAANTFPGLIVGIRAPDEGTYITTRGLAGTDPERAMLDTDRASISSCTKEFTVTLTLQLVEEGKPRLDDPPWTEDGARGYITYEGEAYDITEAIDPTSTGAAGAIVYDHGFLGFHGAYAGFQSTSMYLPERDAVMVILSNDMADLNAPNRLFNQLAEIAFPEEHRD